MAFDLCAAEASRSGGPYLILASSSFYARELTRRLNGEILVHLAGNAELDQSELQQALGPEVDWERVYLEWEGGPIRTVLWAEPEQGTWRACLGELAHRAQPDSRFCTLGTTRLRRLLPEWSIPASRPATAPLNTSRLLVKALDDLGYRARRIYGLHGSLSLLWGTTSRIPGAFGRNDLVDRCFASMRRSYVGCGWQARLAPVWVMVAESGGQDGRSGRD